MEQDLSLSTQDYLWKDQKNWDNHDFSLFKSFIDEDLSSEFDRSWKNSNKKNWLLRFKDQNEFTSSALLEYFSAKANRYFDVGYLRFTKPLPAEPKSLLISALFLEFDFDVIEVAENCGKTSILQLNSFGDLHTTHVSRLIKEEWWQLETSQKDKITLNYLITRKQSLAQLKSAQSQKTKARGLTRLLSVILKK